MNFKVSSSILETTSSINSPPFTVPTPIVCTKTLLSRRKGIASLTSKPTLLWPSVTKIKTLSFASGADSIPEKNKLLPTTRVSPIAVPPTDSICISSIAFLTSSILSVNLCLTKVVPVKVTIPILAESIVFMKARTASLAASILVGLKSLAAMLTLASISSP